MDKEKRKRLRISFTARTRIFDPETGSVCDVGLTDISMNGMSGTASDIPIKSGQYCVVEIIIPGKSSRLILEVHGKVARNTGNVIAVEFENDLEWWAIFSIYKPFGCIDNMDIDADN